MKYSDVDVDGIPFKNEIGQNIQKLVPYKTVWASVEPLSGKEILEAERNKNEQNYRIYTRYIQDLRDVNLIINFRGRKFEIESVINYRESNEMLQFICTEKVGETIE